MESIAFSQIKFRHSISMKEISLHFVVTIMIDHFTFVAFPLACGISLRLKAFFQCTSIMKQNGAACARQFAFALLVACPAKGVMLFVL